MHRCINADDDDTKIDQKICGWAYNFFVWLSLLQMSVAQPELNIIGINKKSSQKLSRKLKSCLALVSLFGAPQRFNF